MASPSLSDAQLIARCVVGDDRHAFAELAKRGHKRAIVSCDPANVASIAGIQRAGFRLVRSLDTQILLSFIARQEVAAQSARVTTRFFVV